MASSSDNDPTTLYRLFDREERLLYVGISASRLGIQRFGQHARGKKWWQEIADVRLQHFNSRKVAMEKELEAIKTEAPLYNIASNPNAGKEEEPLVFKPAEGKWTFRAKRTGYERTIDLFLYPEPDFIPYLDDAYYDGVDGDELIDYYGKVMERKGRLNDEIEIQWFVRSSDEQGFIEFAPAEYQPHVLSKDRHFLGPEGFTTPRNGDEEIDWFQLPVQGVRFKTFWDALGYLPSPFQPYFPLRSLMKSRWW